jgi:hypothetical protein
MVVEWRRGMDWSPLQDNMGQGAEIWYKCMSSRD